MNYPTEILPNERFKKIDGDISDHYLIRHTNSANKEDLWDTTVNQIKLTQIVDPSQGMSDLSTSLLGVFQPDFIKINLTVEGKEKYNDYCEPDAKIECPVYPNDYEMKDSRGYWVVLIGDIDELTADYTKGDINNKFKATCVIEHTPMKWNYWHFSIRWKTEDQGFWHELGNTQKKSLAKRLAHEARANIAKFAKLELPDYSKLPDQKFIKE